MKNGKLNLQKINNQLMAEANILNNKLKMLAEKYDFELTPNFTEITEEEVINFKDNNSTFN